MAPSFQGCINVMGFNMVYASNLYPTKIHRKSNYISIYIMQFNQTDTQRKRQENDVTNTGYSQAVSDLSTNPA